MTSSLRPLPSSKAVPPNLRATQQGQQGYQARGLSQATRSRRASDSKGDFRAWEAVAADSRVRRTSRLSFSKNQQRTPQQLLGFVPRIRDEPLSAIKAANCLPRQVRHSKCLLLTLNRPEASIFGMPLRTFPSAPGRRGGLPATRRTPAAGPQATNHTRTPGGTMEGRLVAAQVGPTIGFALQVLAQAK
jgi:hypothetical protein